MYKIKIFISIIPHTTCIYVHIDIIYHLYSFCHYNLPLDTFSKGYEFDTDEVSNELFMRY